MENQSQQLNKEYKAILLLDLLQASTLIILWVLIKSGLIKGPDVEPLGGSILRPLLYFMGISSLFVTVYLNKVLLKKVPTDNFKTLVNKLKVQSLTVIGVCLMPSMYGIVAYALLGSQKDFYIFATMSFLMIGVFFPRYEKWEAYALGGRV